MLMITLYAEQKKRHRCIEQSFRLGWRRRGWDVSREQHQNVYYLGWNRSPAQVGCMRQALGHGALGRPRGIRWRGRWEGGSGWGTHVNPWLFHFNVWQNPLQYKKFKKKLKKKKKPEITDGCDIFCLLTWQEIFSFHRALTCEFWKDAIQSITACFLKY